MFSSRLYRDEAQRAKEEPEFLTVLDGFREHYQPVGFIENFWLERIATEAFRYARNLRHEQNVFDNSCGFLTPAPASLLRYQASISKHLSQSLAQLDSLQAARKAREAAEGDDHADETENVSWHSENEAPDFPRGDVHQEDDVTAVGECQNVRADEEHLPGGPPDRHSDTKIVETNPPDVSVVVPRHENVETNPPSAEPLEGVEGT